MRMNMKINFQTSRRNTFHVMLLHLDGLCWMNIAVHSLYIVLSTREAELREKRVLM